MTVAARLAICGLLLCLGLPALAQDPPAAPASGPYPTASEVRVGGDAKQTRFVLDLTRKIDIAAFTLANPYRVVVDLPQVTFQLPPRTGEVGRGLVKAFRYGLVMQGGSRIVLDLASPARVDKAFVIDAVDGQPARLVLDLVAIDREAFMRGVSAEKLQPRQPPKIDPPAVTAGDPRPMIVIDPGHGGIDTGTRAAATGIEEKALALEFALMLRDKIEKTGKYRVAMTRTDDTFIALAERVKFARARKAQLFISIHCDALAHGEGDATGATIYTLSDHATDSEAAKLAEAENRADIIAGVDLAAEASDIAEILIDLAQRETKTFSLHFARSLATDLKAATRMHKEPLKSASFVVLKAPDVPSVLLELGYVSNAGDLKHLTSDVWRQKTGEAIVQAVNTYFATRIAGGGPRAGSN